MHAHPDADAFVRAILRDPADLTTRLVFADWLEETGDPSNVAWAQFIRLMAEADRHQLGSQVRSDLEHQASGHAQEIRTALVITTALLLRDPTPLLAVLPAWRIRVEMRGTDTPCAVIEVLHESVARECKVLPLYLRGRTLLVAMADPSQQEIPEKPSFILNKALIAVRVETQDLESEIDDRFRERVTETVEFVLYESPLVGLQGDEVSDVIFRIFHTAFSRGATNFSMGRGGFATAIRYERGLEFISGDHETHHSFEIYERLLSYLRGLDVEHELSKDGITFTDVNLPLLSDRPCPITLERPAGPSPNWFCVRFR
jgi:uncharacterized protein (TIGR02996 family)